MLVLLRNSSGLTDDLSILLLISLTAFKKYSLKGSGCILTFIFLRSLVTLLIRPQAVLHLLLELSITVEL